MRKVILGCALFPAFFCGACGSDNSSGGSLDGGRLPDGAPAPIGTGPGGNPGPKAGGNITMFQSMKSGGGNTDYELTISALLTDGATVEQANGCQITTAESCRVAVCEKSDGGVAAGAYRSAGTLQFAGLAAPASMTPKNDKSYDSYHATSQNKSYIAPNASISVNATGGDIPAFQGSVTAGSTLSVSQPQVSQFFTTNIPNGDVMVSWSGNKPSDQVQVMVSANAAADGAKNVIITCNFTGSSGKIPKAAMDLAATTGAISIGTFNTSVVKAGTYEVTLGVFQPDKFAVYTKQ